MRKKVKLNQNYQKIKENKRKFKNSYIYTAHKPNIGASN
jgi:hypothetical protein